MCGIAISKDNLKKDYIKHRGIEYNEIKKDGFIYSHHRLPIQTLEGDNWLQPILLNNNDLLLFNGEIFNYDKKKYINDTEYLQSFFYYDIPLEYKLDEINTWDGFWSIVLIRKNKTICFTDPLGKKQLYYNDEREISSEIKGLSNTKEIDYEFISIINKWGYNFDDKTIYKDVKRILPNKIYTFFNGKKEYSILDNYFDFYENIPNKSIYDILDESVSNRLISKKYKISTLFSGGLDSTIILYFLKKYNIDINIYSIDNTEDIEYVKYIEKEWNLNINYIDKKSEDILLEDKMKIYYINDSPIDLGSVIPQYYLFKDIKDKIVLTGDGADEAFGGYRRITEYDSQKSDIFQELSFYHLIRLDRMSMNFTIECRSPFLSHDLIRKALTIPYEERINKKILKEEFKEFIPYNILNREKNPLKINEIRIDEKKYRNNLIKNYLEYIKTF